MDAQNPSRELTSISDDYLNEFVFRFNRRKSASRGKLFLRLAQHALPMTYESRPDPC
jgi:hypothetical protein